MTSACQCCFITVYFACIGLKFISAIFLVGILVLFQIAGSLQDCNKCLFTIAYGPTKSP